MLVEGKAPEQPEPLGRLRLMAVSRDPAQAQATIKRLQALDRERKQMEAQAGLKIRFTPTGLFPKGPPEDHEALADSVLRRLVVTKVRKTTHDAVAEACRTAAPAERVAVAVRLILASPEYQME